MSIKVKLSFFISLIVTIILLLNITFGYFSSKDTLCKDLENQMSMITKEIGIALEHSQEASQFIEDSIGEKLRIASIAAIRELGPDVNTITNEQLVRLSEKLGVSHISLLEKNDQAFTITKSSDPKEINLSSKGWGYWNTAIQQLYANQAVTLPEGQKLTNYWAGPFDISSSSPNHVDKWGYYYDGTTNYIIDPYMRDEQIKEFEQITGSKAIVDQTLKDNKLYLEITGFNPLIFGRKAETTKESEQTVIPLLNRPTIFGEYTYTAGASDETNVQLAFQTGETITSELSSRGKHVIKSFIPIKAKTPYVIGMVADYNSINNILNKQLMQHVVISLSLLFGVIIASYFLASFIVKPLDRILKSVNQIAKGQFNVEIPINGKDEFGELALRINTMSQNLELNTQQLQNAVTELRSTKEYLESFVNHTSDAIIVVDLHGKVQQINKAFEKMFGWSFAEMVANPDRMIPEGKREEASRIIGEVQSGGQVSGFETVRRIKDGRAIDVSVTVSPIRDESEEIVAVASITRNITERKQTEELLRRSEKLSIVGQLAAGVAHEIRNPLTTLRGFVQLQQSREQGNKQHLEIMLSELDRINFIVSEFMILAKPQVNDFQYRDLKNIVQGIIVLLDSQANMDNIQISTQMEANIPNIKCEENQLKQVFINLLKNGMEAMEGGGEIYIEIKNIDANRVMIRILDHGCGIPEDQIARLGEPFFTNKETGNGLGLMVSQQIIANHKGNILIRSELGKGTCVDIILPVHLSD